MYRKLYGINEGSWANITSLYSYMFHHNYMFDVPIELEVCYPKSLHNKLIFDKDMRFQHWEQEETWLEQAEFIYNLFLNKPPHNNKMFHREVDSLRDYIKIKRRLYSYEVKRLKLLKQEFGDKDVNKQTPYIMVWPLRNNFTRIPNKVVISRPSETIMHWRLEQKYNWYDWLNSVKKNYNTVEINYRTPIREVIYHLSTCEFSFSGTGGISTQFSVGLGTPTLIMGGFKKSGTEQFERFVPIEDFHRCGDRGYIDNHVEIARETVNTLIPSLEMIGAF